MTPVISLAQALPMSDTARTSVSADRREGILKVKGGSPYAAISPCRDAPAVLAVSSIARGRVTFLTASRQGHRASSRSLTPANRPALRRIPTRRRTPSCSGSISCRTTRYATANQPIAVVIAQTLEPATEGAGRCCRRDTSVAGPRRSRCAESFVRPAVGVGNRPKRDGGCRGGSRGGSTRIEATYETPAIPQCHGAPAIVAVWDGDRCPSIPPSQALAMAQGRIAGLFGHRPGEDPYSQPFLGAASVEGLLAAEVSASWGAAGRPARQARAAP